MKSFRNWSLSFLLLALLCPLAHSQGCIATSFNGVRVCYPELPFFNARFVGGTTVPGNLVFTDGTYQSNFTSIVNGAVPTFFTNQVGQPANADAIGGFMVVPSSSTKVQSDGLSGGCATQSTTTFCLGLTAMGVVDVSGGAAFGATLIAIDAAGTPAHGLNGAEVDMQLQNPASSYAGLDVSDNFRGVDTVFYSVDAVPNFGIAYDSNSPQNVQGSAFYNGSYMSTSYRSNDGAAPIALNIGAVCAGTATNCPSQSILMYSISSGGVRQLAATMYADATGHLIITPLAGVTILGPQVIAPASAGQVGLALVASDTGSTKAITVANHAQTGYVYQLDNQGNVQAASLTLGSVVYTSSTAAASACGGGSAAGCVIATINGVNHFVPYY